jgi:GTPase Era involved in 16S rRNA processing
VIAFTIELFCFLGAVSDADVILLVTDVFGEPLADEKVMSRLAVSSRPVVVVVNKIDLAAEDGSPEMSMVSCSTVDAYYDDGLHGELVDSEDNIDDEDNSSSRGSGSGRREKSSAVAVPLSMSALRSVWKQRLPLAAVVGVSALRGEGVGSLLDTVLQRLSPGPKYFPSEVLTNRDERFFAAEIVREALLALFKVSVYPLV